MKKKKQNKHLDPFFRKKIIDRSGRHPEIGQNYVEFCKSLGIALPKHGINDLKNIIIK
jgi:hypothetical protein